MIPRRKLYQNDRPKALIDERRAELANEALEHYAGAAGEAIESVALSDDDNARQLRVLAIQNEAKRDAATRMRKPRQLKGDKAELQGAYDDAFAAEKRRLAWPRNWP